MHLVQPMSGKITITNQYLIAILGNRSASEIDKLTVNNQVNIDVHILSLR